jgi:hypothetical protein
MVRPGERNGGVVVEDEPPVARAYRQSDGAVVCSCGDRLADLIQGDTVVIDGMEYLFRRRDDEMSCRTCGFSHPMHQFRFGDGASPADTGQRRRAADRAGSRSGGYQRRRSRD